jgi:hypothetical protein
MINSTFFQYNSMIAKVLLSTAYLAPVQYVSLIACADEIFIEKEENYVKQTFRNRCNILSANGPLALTIPVKRGSIHKTQIKDIEIDYSKRWQPVHLMAITSAYKSAAFYDFYYDKIEEIILNNHRFLIDLNWDALTGILEMMKINSKIRYSSHFEPVAGESYDYRYTLNPKFKITESDIESKRYFQLFPGLKGFFPNLSIIDLLFNTGPEAINYLY